MIIRYYDSDLSFESAETIDYYTDYAALSAGNGAKFISYPNQRFARALRQTQMLYVHGLGGGGVLQNEDFGANFGFIAPWIFAENGTDDRIVFLWGGNGAYIRIIADNDGLGFKSLLSQTGSLVSSAGGTTQLRFTIIARLAQLPDGPIAPGTDEPIEWYLRCGTSYYDADTDSWVGSFVFNTLDIPLSDFTQFSFTTPIIPASGVVEVGVSNILGDSDIAQGVDYDLVQITVITDGEDVPSYATNYRGNIDTRASLTESIGTVLNADGPTGGNQSRLTRDEEGTISTTSWGGTPLQDVIVKRWLGVLRANRRLIEGEMIGIDPLGRISRGLFYDGRYYAPVFAEWLAKSRTWRVRLHEYATDETDITNNLTREDNRRNKSGDLYEAPETESIS